jgi:hypothetical protein
MKAKLGVFASILIMLATLFPVQLTADDIVDYTGEVDGHMTQVDFDPLTGTWVYTSVESGPDAFRNYNSAPFNITVNHNASLWAWLEWDWQTLSFKMKGSGQAVDIFGGHYYSTTFNISETSYVNNWVYFGGEFTVYDDFNYEVSYGSLGGCAYCPVWFLPPESMHIWHDYEGEIWLP